ncbi:MAG: c-type cytochrome biogenesis protein CcmI [Methyloceanibacter sp.]|nr:c-type cytochrome biogenesis protein CcmI [Methyloceanibacter sp.]
MLLWVILAALTAVVLSFLLYPLVVGREVVNERDAFDAAVYRDQLDEIEADRARGLIGDAEAEAARLEVARRLLAVDEKNSDASGEGSRGLLPRAALVLVVACLPATVLGAYLYYGSPQLPDQPLAARLTDPGQETDIGVLVARVEARLRAFPDEGAGWDAIAPIYLSGRRYADAAEAYRQAIRLLGPSAKRLSGLGQALVLEQQGLVTEPARIALEEALKQDETLIEPRILLAIAKEQEGNFDDALADWRGLRDARQDDERWTSMVDARIANAQARKSGEAPAAVSPLTPQAGPSAADVAAAQNMTPAEREAMVDQMVKRLAARLETNGDDLPGWLRLVRAYTVLGRSEDAKKALAQAKDLFAGNAQAIKQLDTLAADLGLTS